MPKLNNTIEILKLLNKSNCRECGLPTCLAFAAGVFKGQKSLSDCPHLDQSILGEYSVGELITAPAVTKQSGSALDIGQFLIIINQKQLDSPIKSKIKIDSASSFLMKQQADTGIRPYNFCEYI